MIKYPTIKDLYKIFSKYPVISTDTRNIPKGSIFFALKGEKFDGNSFAKEALDKGAAYAVVDDPKCLKDKRYILVKDTLKTLQNLASFHRQKITIPIIAICGSNGKTTTKELIRSVLSKKFNVFSTPGNLNNHIGVPLSLLRINKNHQLAIIEMGANHIGEIKKLCEIARPTMGLITNNGEDHLEGYGGIEGVIKSNNELYQFLRKNKGFVFVNADDKTLMKLSKNIRRMTYNYNEKEKIISPALFGNYNFENIAAAICVGKYFNVPLEKIKEAIKTFKPISGRSEIKNLPELKSKLIMDAYNANPTSMKKVIENFRLFPHKRKIICLGDMAELGKYSARKHKEIFDLTLKSKFYLNIFIGPNFYKIYQKNLKKCSGVFFFKNTEELKYFIQKNKKLFKKSFILLKASRVMAFERIIDYLYA